MFVVDANVLVYAADRESPFHARCLELLEGWRNQPSVWYVTWGILYEFLRVTTHRRVFRCPWTAPAAWAFVQGILASPSVAVLRVTDRHADVISELLGEVPHLSGNLMHDLHTAALMREHGVRRIYTRDTDFHRFRFLEPIDPSA